MANPRFKVKRQAYFQRGITTASTINTTGTVTIGGSAIFGSGGTAIAGILAGSGALTFGAVAASAASATCFPVTGLTTAHKIFITAASLSACVTVACAQCYTGTPACLNITVLNQSTEALGAGTSTVYYLAVLDK